jgi:isoquinoline 1-oxidoreductase
MQFENGKIFNASFGDYLVPRLDDVPELEIYPVHRPDLSSAGAGETPIIAIAPAIANAAFPATGRQRPGDAGSRLTERTSSRRTFARWPATMP